MKKILIIQQKMIGDVLVSSILCNNLKKAYPNAEIHYMVYESTVAVLEGNPNIDKLVLFTDTYRKNKWAFFKFMLQIRKEKYDVLIDAYSKLESWLTTYFADAKRSISYKKPGRTFLYTEVINTFNNPFSNLGLIIERRLSLLDPLNLDIDLDPVPKLYVTTHEQQFARQLMVKHGVDRSKKSIMISIIGSSAIKTYPLHYMSQLIDFVVAQTHANILFNYIPNQLEQAQQIYNGCKKSTQKAIFFDLLGKNLREYIALMSECDMIIGNDGGAINMAKALDKPSFIIFSPWIEKHMWATFEDEKFHKSVHLQEFKPNLFTNKTEKELKHNSIALYQHFKPEFIYDALQHFLKYNLNTDNKLDILSLIKSKNFKDRKPFSAIVITKNEAANVASLIRNLSFADELLFIDSFSTDETAAIVKEHPEVRFIQRKFTNYSDQRNFGIEQAKNDWILFVDADERIPKALQSEIYQVLSSDNMANAYEIYRQFYFANQPLQYGGFQTDKVIRFFNKNYARYDDKKLVHETFIFKGNLGVFKTKLLHYSYQDFNSYKAKMTLYAALRAKELKAKNIKPNLLFEFFKPAYRFFYHYIIRRGFLDGKAGYIMARLNAYSVKKRFVELKKLNQ